MQDDDTKRRATGNLPDENVVATKSTAAKFRKITDVLSLEGGDAIVHNFPGSKTDQYRLMALATGPGCLPFEKMEGGLIDLHLWFAHRIEMESKTGDIITPIRTVLIAKDGSAYGFVSDGIAKELDVLRSAFGDGPYTEPMELKITHFQTARKNWTYSMGPA